MHGFPITALRSVELSTPDLPGSVDFYTRIWGLQAVSYTHLTLPTTPYV